MERKEFQVLMNNWNNTPDNMKDAERKLISGEITVEQYEELTGKEIPKELQARVQNQKK